MMFPFGGVPKTGYVEFMFEFKAKIENPDSRGVGPRGATLAFSEKSGHGESGKLGASRESWKGPMEGGLNPPPGRALMGGGGGGPKPHPTLKFIRKP